MGGYNICFVLGYQAENKTEIYRKLVDIFGVGGVVSRDQEGRVRNEHSFDRHSR